MLVVTYNPEWPNHFKEISEKLFDKLNHLNIAIEHIGSTSIKGLAAKPIIDIDIVYQANHHFERIKEVLESVGYLHHGNQGILGREVFKRSNLEGDDVLDKIIHHLYVCEQNCDELNNHLFFRDQLRKNTSAKKCYQELKFSIAAEANNDRKKYAAIKEVKANAFIKYVIELEKLEQNTNNEPNSR